MQADVVKDSSQYLPARCPGIRQNPALQEDSPLVGRCDGLLIFIVR